MLTPRNVSCFLRLPFLGTQNNITGLISLFRIWDTQASAFVKQTLPFTIHIHIHSHSSICIPIYLLNLHIYLSGFAKRYLQDFLTSLIWGFFSTWPFFFFHDVFSIKKPLTSCSRQKEKDVFVMLFPSFLTMLFIHTYIHTYIHT